MAFDDHLGPDEDIGLSLHKRLQDLLVGSLFRRGIRVHPKDPGLGKGPLCDLLQLLGPGAKGGDIGRAADRTHPWHTHLMAAVMAPQDPVPVVRQAHVAVGALHGLPTGTAGYEARIAPAVHEQHDLFLP